MSTVKSYGIIMQNKNSTNIDHYVEEIQRNGFAVIPSGFDEDTLSQLDTSFKNAHLQQIEKFGAEMLQDIDELNGIRSPLYYDDIFFKVCTNNDILNTCKALIGDYIILNQQNGVINPKKSMTYNQGFYHRDLPYQHFTSSRPLAVNALFCLDDFTAENGSTFVLPGSHKFEGFPSDEFIKKYQIQASAKRGDFIVMDCMLYHSGGVNSTENDRRAINNVYTIPMMSQQISFTHLKSEIINKDPDVKKLLGLELNYSKSISDYYAYRKTKSQ